MGLDIIEGRVDLLKDADHGLRIVAPRDLFEDVTIDLDHLTPSGAGGSRSAAKHRVTRSIRAMKQNLGRMPQVDCLGNDLQALGEEQAAVLTLLAQVQAPHGLDGGVGQGGDGAAGHAAPAPQRAKKDRPTPRWL